ncbi:MAG: NAD-dependent deacylase [Bacteroidales bacterium]|nr:NAD-dependent deacylase [Bacteroidales bacterium]
MKKIVVLSGAGVSAESGIRTFRDSNGLWEEYRVEDVASIEGWYRNKELVLEFYNQRRRALKETEPNLAHKIIAELEECYKVCVVTQNVDNLHERAGSTNVIHLHGELTKARSTKNEEKWYDIGYNDINLGDKAPDGGQLRPFIVWFGESVPKLSDAAKEVQTADILIIIGTSLNVYPAAGLVHYTKPGCKIYLIDPQPMNLRMENFTQIQDVATEGMKKLKEELIK